MPLALFDLDHTLLDGDCESLWAEFIMARGLAGDNFIQEILRFYRDYEAGTLDYIAYEACLLRPLTQLTPDALGALRDAYMERIRPIVRPYMLDRLKKHWTAGDSVVLISASNAFLVEPIARLLGITQVICTEVETANGVPTANILGAPAFQEGKILKLQKWLESNPHSTAGSWGYSDSHNDLPLLEWVTYPVAVTPDVTLRKIASERGWEIIN